jgi:hypothetical protein
MKGVFIKFVLMKLSLSSILSSTQFEFQGLNLQMGVSMFEALQKFRSLERSHFVQQRSVLDRDGQRSTADTLRARLCGEIRSSDLFPRGFQFAVTANSRKASNRDQFAECHGQGKGISSNHACDLVQAVFRVQ